MMAALLLSLGSGVASAVPDTPTADFTGHGDGTVTHTKTGLTWMRCSLGQTWTGSTCQGTAALFTYAQALALQPTFAGYDDWRLPNIAELQTIVERDRYYPAINTTVFPNIDEHHPYVSSSAYTDAPRVPWTVGFYRGCDSWPPDFSDYSVGNEGYLYAVRLVRSEAPFDPTAASPTSDFTDLGNGTVTHSRTGLTWMRCAMGQDWDGNTCQGVGQGYTWTQAQTSTHAFAGWNDWRLPTAGELLTIMDYSTHANAYTINREIFPLLPSSSSFWTASVFANNPNHAWFVRFDNGFDCEANKSAMLAVRLVRGGPAVIASKVDLTARLTASPKPLPFGTALALTATVTNQGSAQAVGVWLHLTLPVYTEVSSIPADCRIAEGIMCSIGRLAGHAKLKRTIVVLPSATGNKRFTFYATSDAIDATPGNNQTSRLVTVVAP